MYRRGRHYWPVRSGHWRPPACALCRSPVGQHLLGAGPRRCRAIGAMPHGQPGSWWDGSPGWRGTFGARLPACMAQAADALALGDTRGFQLAGISRSSDLRLSGGLAQRCRGASAHGYDRPSYAPGSRCRISPCLSRAADAGVCRTRNPSTLRCWPSIAVSIVRPAGIIYASCSPCIQPSANEV